MRNQGEGPADAAWEKYQATGNAYNDTTRAVFAAGWNAALDWIPFRIAQFREIDEAQRKEIEQLKQEIEQLKESQPPKP